jgi:hypothetical protein
LPACLRAGSTCRASRRHSGRFGAGALIAAISMDLVVEAEDLLDPWQFAVWMLVGVAVFLVARQGLV